MKKETKLISFRIQKEIYEHFKTKYPNTTSTFLRKCMIKAIDNYEFIKDIIYNTEEKEKCQ